MIDVASLWMETKPDLSQPSLQSHACDIAFVTRAPISLFVCPVLLFGFPRDDLGSDIDYSLNSACLLNDGFGPDYSEPCLPCAWIVIELLCLSANRKYLIVVPSLRLPQHGGQAL